MGPRRHSPFDPWIGQDHHRYDHRGMVRPPQVWPAYAIQPPLCGRPMPISLSNMDIVGSVITWFCIPSSHGRVTYKSENVHLVWPPRREVDTCQCKSWIFPTIQCQPFTGRIFTIFPTIQEIFYFTNIHRENSSRHLFYTNPCYVVQGRSDWLGKGTVIFSIGLIEKLEKNK